MLKRLKQLRNRLTEFRLYVSYWRYIPRGVRRNIIELCISLGLITKAYTSIDASKLKEAPLDVGIDIAEERYKYIGEYLDKLKEIRLSTLED